MKQSAKPAGKDRRRAEVPDIVEIFGDFLLDNLFDMLFLTLIGALLWILHK